LHALNNWFAAEKNGELFDAEHLPTNIHPRDPEIFWTLREAARLKHEAEGS